MFLFKTKKRIALVSAVSSLTAYGAYDKFQFYKIKRDYTSKATLIAEQSIAPHETIRKVLVYTAPSQYAAYNFKQYVKPIFDAGALDYELVLIEKEGDVYEKVRERIWTGIEEAEARPHLPVAEKKRSWREFLFGKSRDSELDPITRFLNLPNYSPQVGIVALGPEAWREMLKGIQDGCYTMRPKPEIIVENLVSEESVKSSTEDIKESVKSSILENEKALTEKTVDSGKISTVEAKETPISAMEPIEETVISIENIKEPLPLQSEQRTPPIQTPSNYPILEYNTFDLPIVAYIPAENLVGWKKFPNRIYNWFHERHQIATMGEKALDILFEHSHELNDVEEVPSKEEVKNEIKSKLNVYVGRM